MTDDMLSCIISAQIRETLEDNKDVIAQALNECVDPGDCVDPVTVRMVMTAIRVSSQIAVQQTIRFLEEIQVLSLPPDGTPLLQDLSSDN